MTKGGTIGAATAVDMSGKKGSEKVISYMREEMASTAESRDRSKEIARGMVDEELSFTHLIIAPAKFMLCSIPKNQEICKFGMFGSR